MKNYILGTDWWTDCDDVVALRILARAFLNNDICLKAIAINACMEYSVQSVEGFLNKEKVKDIPIGIDLQATDFGGTPKYQRRLAQFAEKYKSNLQAEDAVRLYRRILAESNEKIEIIEIGYLQVIAAVLMSQSDDISEKTGLELVKEKVSKIWVMAGKWDEETGKENNFCRNERARTAASVFCEICPVPVIFLGWEIGYDVITGDELDKEDILYKAMCDHGSENGRSSWDPMLVCLALTGDEEKAGYSVTYGTARVNSSDGTCSFIKSETGLHKFVSKKYDNNYYKAKINELIK